MQPEASVGCNFVKTQKTSQSSGGDLALEQKSYKNVKPNGKKTTEIQSPEKNEQNV